MRQRRVMIGWSGTRGAVLLAAFLYALSLVVPGLHGLGEVIERHGCGACDAPAAASLEAPAGAVVTAPAHHRHALHDPSSCAICATTSIVVLAPAPNAGPLATLAPAGVVAAAPESRTHAPPPREELARGPPPASTASL
jgi:hypothetical protein